MYHPRILAVGVLVTTLLMTLVMPAAAASAGAEAGAPLDQSSQRDLTSYAVGVTTGRALRSADGAEVNLEPLVRGLHDGLEAARLQISERQLQGLLAEFQQTLRQKLASSRGRAVAENRAKSEAFLADNRSHPGVIELPGGVQYRILSSGTGPVPQESDQITARYTGHLLNGHEFDATEPGRPAQFRIASMIPGWREALKHMPVGSHWEIYVPPALAYGERGVGSEIGPNETLVFDVELLSSRPATLD